MTATLLVLVAGALLLQTYELTRFFLSRLRQPLPASFTPRVELFVPCKGIDPHFDQMVRVVLTQHYPAYEVTFVVESADDPAYGRFEQLLAQANAVKARLLVAGRAKDCGQKVHNLLFATARVNPSAEILAFLDSDTCVASDWLHRLIDQLQMPGIGVVTGQRWFMPEAPNWAAATLSALNSCAVFSYVTQ